MTEIPEHLLRRSKERRAALSGEGGGEGAAEATAEATAAVAETPRAAPPVPVEGAPQTQASGGGGAVTGVPRVAAPVPAPAPRLGPTRPGIPLFAVALLVALPLWGIIYLGAFGSRSKSTGDPVNVGGTIFLANCSTCHGANGEGGVGPKLSGGEVLKVWPKVADHIAWVKSGGAPYVGKTIGATHVPVPPNNVMPGFGASLTPDQINDVVCYERVAFGNEKETTANCPGFTG